MKKLRLRSCCKSVGDVEPKPPINTMHQSLAEKQAEASKNTLVDSVPEVKAQKVGETMTDVKGASLF